MLPTFIPPLLNGAGLALLFGAPLLVIAWIMHRRRRQYREHANDPFIDMPLRPPGESLRIKIEQLTERYDDWVSTGFLTAVLAAGLVSVAPHNEKVAVALGAIPAAAIFYLMMGRKMFRLQKQLWDYRLGFTAERATGEELNQLVAAGFKVFHDVPFDSYNVDHVIVGPPGVYAVETKGRRKPANIKGVAKATVIFDGVSLAFPRYSERKSVEQARLNAHSLSKWLSKATGEQTTVSPILALPGWWIDRRSRSDVNVLNPKEIITSFPSRIPSPLSPDRIGRISHQLSERCRLAKPL